MPTYTYPASARPTIRLRACDSDVTINGVDTATIELATSDDDLSANVIQTNDGLEIERTEDRLSLRVPRSAQITIEQQCGDILIQDVAGVELTDISGDVKLRAITGDVQLDSIEGDLLIDRAHSIRGQYIGGDARFVGAAALTLGELGGDVRVSDIAAVRIEQISGDAQISGAQEQCELGTVEGDLKIRGAGVVVVGRVSGDFAAEQVGTIEIKTIQGDCTINSEQGAATIGVIDGDLHARIQRGPLQVVRISGDAKIDGVAAGLELGRLHGDLDLRPEPEDAATYRAHVSGDALVSLPTSCDLTIEARVEGAVSGVSNGRGRRQSGEISLVLGTGAAQLTLAIDGDLTLRGAGLRAQPRPLPISRSVDAPGVRVEPATGPTVRLQVEPPRRPPSGRASDEERLALLRMLSEGRISVDEAERLLKAVDQPSVGPNRAAEPAPESVADLEAFED